MHGPTLRASPTTFVEVTLTRRVETLRHAPDEITVRLPSGLFHFLPCGIRRAVGNVFVNRACKQDGVLEDDTDTLAP
jgi:hypothetical protein